MTACCGETGIGAELGARVALPFERSLLLYGKMKATVYG